MSANHVPMGAETGADILMRSFTNLNTLGEPEGYKALINAILTIDLARKDLEGSAIGEVIAQEYPLLYVLPMGSTFSCGKSTFGRELGRALVPDLPLTIMNQSEAAAAQHELADTIKTHGTAALDAFQIPNSSAHFLNGAGLQALATGASVAPGKVSEDDEGVHLSHPLVLIGKAALAPESIVLRAVPTFLGELRDFSPESFPSHAIGDAVRQAHLQWMQDTKCVEHMRQYLMMESDLFRFYGHYTLATMFSSVVDVDLYLVRAQEQMRTPMTTNH